MVFADYLLQVKPAVLVSANTRAKIYIAMQMRHLVLLSVLMMLTTLLNAQCLFGDCTQGNGVFRFPGGDTYTGSWDSSSMHGYGRYDWVSGSWYVGEFSRNQMQGKGAFYGVDGRRMEGLFEANVYVGPDSLTREYPSFNPASAAAEHWAEVQFLDSIALIQTLTSAQQVTFCELMSRLIASRNTGLSAYYGEPVAASLGRDMRYFATILPVGGSEATISTSAADSTFRYSAKLFQSADSATAWSQFKVLQEQVTGCTPEQAQFQAVTVSSIAASRTMQSVVWIPRPDLPEQTAQQLADLTIQFTCKSTADQSSWEVFITISDE